MLTNLLHYSEMKLKIVKPTVRLELGTVSENYYKGLELKEASFSEILDNKVIESSCNCKYRQLSCSMVPK